MATQPGQSREDVLREAAQDEYDRRLLLTTPQQVINYDFPLAEEANRRGAIQRLEMLDPMYRSPQPRIDYPVIPGTKMNDPERSNLSPAGRNVRIAEAGSGIKGIISDAAARYGLDADYMDRIARIESGHDPRNRTGSYHGLFQLSGSEFARNGGRGNIYDPAQNANAAAAMMAQQRADFTAKYGRPPTPTEAYMIHQQGAGGLDAHLANPNEPAWVNMANTAEGRQKGVGWAKAAIWGNIPDAQKREYGNVNNVTSADFINKVWAPKVEGREGTSSVEPQVGGEAAPIGLTSEDQGMGAKPAYMGSAARQDLGSLTSAQAPDFSKSTFKFQMPYVGQFTMAESARPQSLAQLPTALPMPPRLLERYGKY